MKHLIKSYFEYFFKATNAHGLHSPFVFNLYNEVIKNRQKFYAFKEIENLRFQFLGKNEIIEVQDFGAGSHIQKKTQKSLSYLAKTASAPPKEAQLLFKLINYFDCKNIIELGTCIGLTTLYLHKVNTKNKIITFEGCPNLANIATKNFQKLNADKNIEIIVGNLDNTLEKKLKEIKTIDFLFLDANHQLLPTLRYFELCLPKLHQKSIVVLDDIHWSKEMQEAWQQIQNRKEVTISIDLFGLGILFFHQKQNKENFVLKF
jgi:predicted O-methyltransferase YrrM